MSCRCSLTLMADALGSESASAGSRHALRKSSAYSAPWDEQTRRDVCGDTTVRIYENENGCYAPPASRKQRPERSITRTVLPRRLSDNGEIKPSTWGDTDSGLCRKNNASKASNESIIARKQCKILFVRWHSWKTVVPPCNRPELRTPTRGYISLNLPQFQ